MQKFRKQELLDRIDARIEEIEQAFKEAEERSTTDLELWKPTAISATTNAIKALKLNTDWRRGNAAYYNGVRSPDPKRVIIEVNDNEHANIYGTHALRGWRAQIEIAVPDKDGNISLTQPARFMPTDLWSLLTGVVRVV